MARKTPGKLVKTALEKAVEKVTELTNPPIPGTPGSEAPSLEEPVDPRGPLPPKPDQDGPETVTPTGAPTGAPKAVGGAAGCVPHDLDRRPAARHRPFPESGGAGPDPAAGSPPAREGHALRPRAHPGAGRARAWLRRARRVRRLRHGLARLPGRLPGQRRRDAGVRAVLHGRRLARVGRRRARHPGVRDEVLHPGRQLRPGRQQHPGLLHPGRDQVPRHHPRGQTPPGPRDPAGAERPRHVLGLRVDPHRSHPPRAVADVRPRDPPLLPDDGGLRGPHLPARQRRRGVRAREVPLEAEAGRALPGLGGGAAAQRRRPGLPPPRPRRRHRVRRVPAVGARRADLPGHPEADVRRHRPAGPDEAGAGGARAGAAGGDADAQPEPDELLRRDRAGRVPRREPGARHRRHRRPAAARAAVLLPGHPADQARGTELQPDPRQPPARAGQRPDARRLPPAGDPRRRRPVQTELPRRRQPVRGRRRGPSPSSKWLSRCRRPRRSGSHRCRSPTTTRRRGCSG